MTGTRAAAGVLAVAGCLALAGCGGLFADPTATAAPPTTTTAGDPTPARTATATTATPATTRTAVSAPALVAATAFGERTRRDLADDPAVTDWGLGGTGSGAARVLGDVDGGTLVYVQQPYYYENAGIRVEALDRALSVVRGRETEFLGLNGTRTRLAADGNRSVLVAVVNLADESRTVRLAAGAANASVTIAGGRAVQVRGTVPANATLVARTNDERAASALAATGQPVPTVVVVAPDGALRVVAVGRPTD